MSEYEKILDTAWSDIAEVQTLPRGSWLLKCRGASFQAPKSADHSPAVVFVYEAKEPMEDVADEDMEALGADYDPASNRIFHRHWVGDGADKHALRILLAKHGIDPNDYSFRDSLAAVKGREIVGFLDTETYKDKVQNVVKTFTAVE